jgi:histidinol-phosphate aminotransferase
VTLATSLSFLRAELTQLQAYTPHPGGTDGQAAAIEIDRLDTNESPYDLPIELKQELAQMWVQAIESNRYPDGSHHHLKMAIADYATESARLPAQISPDRICVGNGSDELLRSILIATCVGGMGSILVATPTFSMYGILAQTLGIPVVSIDRSEQNFEIDLAAAQQAIVNSQQQSPIRVVFMVHPNSPTGNALTAAEIKWLESLPEHILVVIDEAYFEYSQQTLIDRLSAHPNWLVLRTFSKAFRLAAHRVGYGVGHPDLIAALERVRLPYNLPSLSLAAAELALKHRQSLLATIDETISERDRLLTTLSKLDGLQVWRSDANFIYARLPEMVELTHELKIQGTLIRHTGGGLRISIGTPEENHRTAARIATTLDRLK